MKRATLILIGLAMLALASFRSQNKSKSNWFRHLSGSQKIFGVVAFILAVVILINPEFLVLGFLGDTAFFDMLVLAIGLQLHTHVLRAVRWLVTALRKCMRWAGIPSPGFYYAVAVATVLIGSAISVVQKAVHRILS